MGFAHTGMMYLGSVLRVALGAGAVLGSCYVFSRIREKQTLDARLDRLEQMLEKLASPEEKETKGAQAQEH